MAAAFTVSAALASYLDRTGEVGGAVPAVLSAVEEPTIDAFDADRPVVAIGSWAGIVVVASASVVGGREWPLAIGVLIVAASRWCSRA